MSNFVTQCPHCQTSFRVSRAQLAAARGVVRCGACMELFNAARALQGDGAEPAPIAQHSNEPPSEAAPAQRRKPDVSSPGTFWIHDELDLDSLDLDEELAKLERQERQFSREPLGLEPEQSSAEADTLPQRTDEVTKRAADSATPEHEPVAMPPEPIDTDNGAPHEAHWRLTPVAAEYRKQPSPLIASRESQTQPSYTTHRIEPSLDDVLQHSDEPRLVAEPIEPSDEDEPQQTRRTRNEDADPLFELEEEPLQLEWEARRRPWGRWLGWGLLNLIALLALAAQYVTYNFEALARQDEYRPWLERICPAVGCKLPPRVDISQIKSSNLVVRSHPDFAGALIVDAMIYNRAPFAQPFPLLEVQFDDLQGKTLARRTFKPGEYLSGELAGQHEMPSQIPIHISLEILDPGANAVNYSLGFRSPD